MKTKYLLIQTDKMLDEKSEFIVVMVSEQTEIGKRDLDYLHAISDKKGWFFARWSKEVMEFLHKCEESLYQYGGRDAFNLSKEDARDLVRRFKKSESKPINIEAERNRRHLLESIDPDYRIIRNLRDSQLHRQRKTIKT